MKRMFRIASFTGIFLLIWLRGCTNAPNAGGGLFNLHFQVNAAGVPTAILFDYDFTKPQNKPCSGTVTTNCVSGFMLTTLSGTTQVGAPTSISLPASLSTTAVTVGITTPYTAPISLGNYSVCIQVNYKDGTGTVQGGVQGCLGYAILPDAPLNVRMTP